MSMFHYAHVMASGHRSLLYLITNVKAGPALNQLDQLPLHFTVLYCKLPVVTCSVNDMFVDPAELFATHLFT
jgi:hypothetical protein